MRNVCVSSQGTKGAVNKYTIVNIIYNVLLTLHS